MTHSDGGALDQSAYRLVYRKLDLSDFGFAPYEGVSTLEIRGQSPTTIDEDGLDLVAVASLNRPRSCGIGFELVVLMPFLLALHRRRV